jgi:hypothetical protein
MYFVPEQAHWIVYSDHPCPVRSWSRVNQLLETGYSDFPTGLASL